MEKKQSDKQEEDDEPYTYAIQAPTPTHRYTFGRNPNSNTVDSNDIIVKFEAIDPSQRTPLSHKSCVICCSGECERDTRQRPNSKIDGPHSSCRLFVIYSLASAMKSSAYSPCTNVPIECPLCKEYIYKYLFESHYTAVHPGKHNPHTVPQEEMKRCYQSLQRAKCKSRSSKHYKELVPAPKEKTKKKVGQKSKAR